MDRPQDVGTLARLPLEIRWNIYDLTFEDRTHDLACFHEGMVFIRSIDLSPPKIASVCSEMRDYAQKKYQTFVLTYHEKVSKLDFMSCVWDDYPRHCVQPTIVKHLPAWFSTSYDTIELQVMEDVYDNEALLHGHHGAEHILENYDEDNLLTPDDYDSDDSVDRRDESDYPYHSITELLLWRTNDHPETHFRRLLKTKLNEAIQGGVCFDVRSEEGQLWFNLKR
ncbi:hypothetical protein PG993_008386 [Apiospora rasikravindrae]|uniref:2EXR domain-containing protein n=1 Tax=Apiospora rasikravindrae TaxID=990691 RepID=A0ABR1T073_9PEZI